jgi:hypothetical protein
MKNKKEHRYCKRVLLQWIIKNEIGLDVAQEFWHKKHDEKWRTSAAPHRGN